MIKPIKLSYPKVHITSDTHFFHKNICAGESVWPDITKCRQFKDRFQMTETIINNINKYVDEDSLLIHLGDWSFGGKENINIALDAIQCKNIVLVRGNHDHNIEENDSRFLLCKDFLYLNVNGALLVLSHYPMFHWVDMEKGSIMLHGHCHGDESLLLRQIHENYRTMDVGVDIAYKLYNEYRPFELNEAVSFINDKQVLNRH